MRPEMPAPWRRAQPRVRVRQSRGYRLVRSSQRSFLAINRRRSLRRHSLRRVFASGLGFWHKARLEQKSALKHDLFRVKTPKREAAGPAMAHIGPATSRSLSDPSGAVPAVHGVSFGVEISEFLCIV